jgi:hypothetical protein
MTTPGDALYRLILRAFPRSFRERYGRPMEAQFRAQRASLGFGPDRRVLLWARAIVDAIVHGWAVRRDAYVAGRTSRPTPALARAWLAFPQDLRFACRGLLRARAMTTVIVLTLTLGIAANAIMFGVVDQLLLRGPAGVAHPDDVRRIYFGSETPERQRGLGEHHGYPLAAAVRDNVPAFSGASVVARANHKHEARARAREFKIVLVESADITLHELQPADGAFFKS